MTQLEKTIADAEADLAKAQASGNARKIKELEQSLASRRAWLDQALQAMNEFTD